MYFGSAVVFAGDDNFHFMFDKSPCTLSFSFTQRATFQSVERDNHLKQWSVITDNHLEREVLWLTNLKAAFWKSAIARCCVPAVSGSTRLMELALPRMRT